MKQRNIEQIFEGGGTRVLTLCTLFDTGVSPAAGCKITHFPHCLTGKTERGEGIE